MSTPISAMIVSAARLPTPVMVASRSRARANGGDHLIDAAVQGGDGALQVLQVLKRQAHQQRVVATKAAP
jgi:hypothetical protein